MCLHINHRLLAVQSAIAQVCIGDAQLCNRRLHNHMIRERTTCINDYRPRCWRRPFTPVTGLERTGLPVSSERRCSMRAIEPWARTKRSTLSAIFCAASAMRRSCVSPSPLCPAAKYEGETCLTLSLTLKSVS